ncbi:hypothetical protein EV714DRAFT_240250 [Schizophyllum commune]
MCYLQTTPNGDQRLLAPPRDQVAGTPSHKMPESQARKELVLSDWSTPTLRSPSASIRRTWGPFMVFDIVVTVGRTQIVQFIVDKLSNILLNLPLLARLAQRQAEFWTRLSYLLPAGSRPWRLGSVNIQRALYSLHRLEILLEQPEIWMSFEARLESLRLHAYQQMMATVTLRKIGDGGSAAMHSAFGVEEMEAGQFWGSEGEPSAIDHWPQGCCHFAVCGV